MENCIQLLEFNQREIVVAAGQMPYKYEPDQYCNQLTIKNITGTGTAADTVIINDAIVLQVGNDANSVPGESYMTPGLKGEVFKGRITIKAGSAAVSCLIIEKYYTNIK
jgi:hypothetical protein